ncbi:hypothetical protein, partial [Salmonella sp. s55962]|uniref:hypothetical protein n=1 Tax=Salmonella sp. s55962 TaxID=3159685 RepID=UPI0039802B7F
QNLKMLCALTRLEEQDGYLSKVKVNEVFGFMGNVTSKIASNNAMPCGAVLFVKFLFDESSNILFNVEFFHCLTGTIYGILLHLISHVSILDDRFPLRHLDGNVFTSTVNLNSQFSLLKRSRYN